MGVFEGQAALVTGGGSGIGLAVAKRLAGDGATVTICGRTEDRLRAAVEEIGEPAAWVRCDVTDETSVEAAVRHVGEDLRIVVACAGGSQHMGPLVASSIESFRATVELNVVGTFLTLKHTAPTMARNGGGSFVAVSSIAGVLSHRYLGAYCVGKAGIDMLVRVAADELGPSGVRVNGVRPGLVDTELVGMITAGGPVLDDYLAQMPLARVGTPDDVAQAVRWLAGPESSWVTGQLVGVDGGHTLRRGPDYTSFAEALYGTDALRGIV